MFYASGLFPPYGGGNLSFTSNTYSNNYGGSSIISGSVMAVQLMNSVIIDGTSYQMYTA